MLAHEQKKVCSNSQLRLSKPGEALRSNYTLKLDYNELPYPPMFLEAQPNYALNRYPEDENSRLLENIARAYRLHKSEVAITHGIDEAIDRLIQLFPHNSFVLFNPTFYGFLDRLNVNEANFRCHTLTSNFRLCPTDINLLKENDIVILASPNNPTGHLFLDTEIEALLKRVRFVFVDETYIDFSSSTGWLSKRPNNMFVFRSFSKSFGLAGVRAGFLSGPQAEIEKIKKKQWFCHMSLPVIWAINQSLASDWRIHATEEVIRERGRVVNSLKLMNFDVQNTETNFVLIRDYSGLINSTLESNGIRVRSAAAMGMPGYLRIAVDSPTNNDFVINVLDSISFKNSLSQREYEESLLSVA